MFLPLTQQMSNVRRWNEERNWGLNPAELDAIDLTPRTHADPLVVDLIAVYLDDVAAGEDEEKLDGVRRTSRELWTIAAEQQPTSWYWDWVRDRYNPRPMPVRLLPGIIHWPGVRRMTIDLGAHWIPGEHLRPSNLRGPDSAHAILAAAAHFPEWIRAMNGINVPYIWLSGIRSPIRRSPHIYGCRGGLFRSSRPARSLGLPVRQLSLRSQPPGPGQRAP
jgi:hypothetical protein